MENKEILEKLTEKYLEMQKGYDSLQEELEKFKTTPESDMYAKLESDLVKETMFPKEYELDKKMEELYTKADALFDEMISFAYKVVEEYEKTIASLDEKLKTNEEYVKGLDEKIEKLTKELEELKQTETYKNGDEEAILKAEELEEEIETKQKRREKIQNKIENIKEERDNIEKEKNEIISKYELDTVNKKVAQEQVNAEQQEAEIQTVEAQTKSKEENQEKKENQEKSAKGKQSKANVVYANAATRNQESEVQEQQEEQLEPKDEFKKLYKTAKKGELTDKEFNRLAEIMSNADNYSKFGISTFGPFSKSKVVLKAMSKSIAEKLDTTKKNMEKLGIDVKIEDKEEILENDVFSSWKGIKTLAENEEQKTKQEVMLEQITNLDRNSLTEEQQAIYDDAKAQLGKIQSFRSAAVVSKARSDRFTNWLYVQDEETQALPESKVENDPPKSGLDFSDKVYEPGENPNFEVPEAKEQTHEHDEP